jgi:serine/threonine protein kinase
VTWWLTGNRCPAVARIESADGGNVRCVRSGDRALPALDEGTVAGRYELGPVIGVGSSAVVRRGRDLHGGTPVAIKLFHPGASANDHRQLQQELAALALLEHSGLVGLYDGGTEEGRPFVVTELVEGPTVAARILDGPMPLDEVRTLGAQLADALAHVHAAGFVHRDIKPANVILGSGNRPRLADFGISRAVESTAATTEGGVVGTAAYLAPEQVRGEVVGPPADVYALGLLLLEALTGRREYPGGAVESATARLFRRPEMPPELPTALSALLTAMTSDDPTERPTAAEVSTGLARRPVAELVAQAGVPRRTPWRRHRHRATANRRAADTGPRSGPRRRVGESRVAVLVLLLLAAVVGVLAVLSWPAALPGALSP